MPTRCVVRRIAALLTCCCALASASKLRAQSPLAAWNSGYRGEPVLAVRVRGEGFWVIRQSKGSSLEAPFIYLIAGSRRALLVDTGAEPTIGTTLPLVALVDSLLATRAPGHDVSRLPLLVTHSHGHGDHRFLDEAFAGRPFTVVISPVVDSLKRAFELPRWPVGEGDIDLGGRHVTVLPTPGHQPAHVMYYDAATATLLGGDMLYPGLLTIRDWPAFEESVERLARFAATHRIAAVLGAHVEMTAVKREMYPLGTAKQPNEHPLALDARVIDSLVAAVAALGDSFPQDVHGDFILGLVRPAIR
ncbi:MAG: MBL fold metallo-hydrolase [Gemmatimonadota bacterium]